MSQNFDSYTEEPSIKEKFGLLVLPRIFKISYVLTLLGLIFKLLGVQMANPILILGMGAFAVCSHLNINFVNSIWGKALTFSISILSIGTLFKIMMWPGATLFSNIGLIGCLAFLLIYHFKETDKSVELVLRASTLIVFVLILHLLPPKTFFTTFVTKDAIAAQLYENMKNNPENVVAREAFNTYWYKTKKSKYSQNQDIPVVTDSINAK